MLEFLGYMFLISWTVFNLWLIPLIILYVISKKIGKTIESLGVKRERKKKGD